MSCAFLCRMVYVIEPSLLVLIWCAERNVRITSVQKCVKNWLKTFPFSLTLKVLVYNCMVFIMLKMSTT